MFMYIYILIYTKRCVCVYITREWAILPLTMATVCVHPGLPFVEDCMQLKMERQLATMVIRCKVLQEFGGFVCAGPDALAMRKNHLEVTLARLNRCFMLTGLHRGIRNSAKN